MASGSPGSASAERMTLGEALSGMLKLYAKKPFVFSGIYLAVMVPVTILNFLLVLYSSPFMVLNILSGDWGAILGLIGILWILYFIVTIVAGVLTLGGVIRAAQKAFDDKKTTIGESISYAFKRIWAYIILALRVFWYSLAWVLLLFVILYPIVASMMIRGAPGGVDISQNPTAYAQMMQFEDLDELDQFYEMFEEFPQFQGDAGAMSTFLAAGRLFLILFLILLVVVFIRALKAFFAFYILFDEESISTKDALKKSIELTKHNLWRIIGYTIVIGLLLGIASGILNSMVARMFGISMNAFGEVSPAYFVWTLLLSSIMYPLSIIYYFVFYKGIRREKGV